MTWTAARFLAATLLAASLTTATLTPVGDTGMEEPVSTVTLLVPGSDVFESREFEVRRRLVAGRLARSWFGFTFDGDPYAASFVVAGHGADPTVAAAATAVEGATHIPIDLGSSSLTPAQVAAAIIAELDGLGIVATAGDPEADGRVPLTIEGASALVVPSAVDTTDNSLGGMWGLQRNNWGTNLTIGQNQNGGTTGTGSIHLPPLGAPGRVLGLYMWLHGGFAPRLALASGPVYSLTPGEMTILGQGVVSSVGPTGLALVLFDEPVYLDGTEQLWALYRENVGGGPRYRAHERTPTGSGDIVVGERLIWDTTSPTSAATPLGATYTPTVNATFTIYVACGVIFELADGSGNYWADGGIDLWVGDQNTNDEHGTQFAAGPALLDLEGTHHRFQTPQWASFPVTQVRRAVDAIAADEGSRMAFHGSWTSLAFPAAPAPALIADARDLGPGLTANAYNTATMVAPIDLGVDALGANAVVSLGFTYVRTGGGVLTSYTLPVFLDVSTGAGYWGNCWVDSRAIWHDDIPGASGRGYVSGVSEYRTTMTGPINDFSDQWDDPLDTSITDDSPNAIALDGYRVQIPGLAEAA